MIITDFINEKAIKKLKKEINNSKNSKLFFRGIPNENNIVVDIELITEISMDIIVKLLNVIKKNEVIIFNHSSNDLKPSKEELALSNSYKEVGGATYIINNDVNDIYVVSKLRDNKAINIDEFFGKEGKIHKKIKNFEIRNEQYEMAKIISESLNQNQKILVEAGTGTGKTVAYLLPTLLYAIENNLKLIISTNTINLQEQLISKDIPLIKDIIDFNFEYEIVKGKGNYLCKRRLYGVNVSENDKDTVDEINEKNIIKNLLKWNKETITGDKNEIKYEVPFKIWDQIKCESDLCTGNRCPYYTDCYFFKARKEINNADLLIVNHHMFFADLSIRNQIGFNTSYSILPNYDIVVFDEAHNIEETARNYFTYEVSRFNFGKLIGNIYNRKNFKNNNSSILIKLLSYLNKNINQDEYIIIDALKEELISLLNKFYDKGIDIFDKIISIFKNEFINGEAKIRLDSPKIKKSKIWNKVLNLVTELKKIYIKLNENKNKFIKYIEKFNLIDSDGQIFDFIKYFDRLNEFYKNFIFIIDGANENYVYWLSISSNKANIKADIKFYATPFNVSKDLKNNLFSKMERMIFTSATLTSENNFSYFKESIGLIEDKKIIEKIINSPFDYEKQMKVYIPEDTLDPNDTDFLDDLEEYILKTIKATEGHCFLLFTSYSSMNYLYNKIERYFNFKEYTLIKQNDSSRSEMIKIFKNSKNPILFGTDSFWEGVDVQGDKLKSVIIIKLPFKVPNDPVTEAIIDNIKKNKKNPFNSYQVPQAVIKFKQGVGRLIRSKNDKGIITILDNRIINKKYGKSFLEILPKNIVKDKRDNIIEMLEKINWRKNED